MRLGWLVGCMVLAVSAEAAETQWWTLDAQADHARSEAQGVVVRGDGSVVTGDAVRSWSADSLRTVWALAVLADGSVAVAGDGGRIDRWTPGQGVRPWARVADGQVLSLAADGVGVVAGTGPRGLLYRISAGGDTTRLATTGERYIWGIARSAGGAWWLATGTRGRLLRWRAGTTEVVWDSDETNLTALVADGEGGVHTAGDSHGRITHVRGDGRARTRWDGPEDEVRALVRDGDGTLWAAALTASAVTGASEEGEAPTPQRAAVAGGRSVVYRIGPDGVAAPWWTAPQPMVFALHRAGGQLFAATGNRAGIHALEGAQSAHLRLALAQGQVTALAALPDGGLLAATSHPAALWRLGPERTPRGVLTAASVDLRRPARLGRVEWNGRGGVRIEVRTGYTETPDSTWESWTAVDGEGQPARSLLGRFVQWRATLEGADARLDAVRFATREPNLAPRIEEISVVPQAQGIRDGGLGPRSEAVTQNLKGGQKVEYSVTMSSNKALRELPLWARGLRTLQWRALDPNGDPLVFRVQVRDADTEGEWIEVGKDLESSMLTWDTASLPDGRYRVRVLASDAPGNAVGEELAAEGVGETFVVDNTPPTIPELAARFTASAVELDGMAEDGRSPLWRLEVSVDDGDWRTLAPVRGVLDQRREPIRARFTGWAAGEHLITVRAVDLAGNSAVRGIRIRVPR